MARPDGAAPTLDEYLTARGEDLLRTAWLVTGDSVRAERLVRTALTRARPRWQHLVELGAGSYHAELRRFLVQAALHEHRPGGRPRRDPGAVSTPQHAVVAAVLRLPVRDRVRLVLAELDRLSDGQLAGALEEPVQVAHERLAASRARVGAETGLAPSELASALERAAPQDLVVDDLRDTLVPPRRRRLSAHLGWAASAAVLASVVAVVAVLARPGPEPPELPTPSQSATLDSSACSTRAAAAQPLAAAALPDRDGLRSVVVCPQTDVDSVWGGYLPPSATLGTPDALALLDVRRRDVATDCGTVPRGPAYRMVVQWQDGTVVTYANEGMACDGWPALASFYLALAEQDAAAQQERWNDGFLGCPPQYAAGPGDLDSVQPLPRGTTFTSATVCVHPASLPGAVPRYRAVLRQVLSEGQVAQLQASLAARGSSAGGAPACAARGAEFVVRATTGSGRTVELVGQCPQRLAVDRSTRHWVTLTSAAAAVVESVLPSSYR